MHASPDREFDLRYREQCRGCLAGVDEVGRGALAGPVVAAAVILPEGADLRGVADSKQLTPRRREEAYGRIVAEATAVGLGMVGPEEIDLINIRQATLLAMRQALAGLETVPHLALVDGRDDPEPGLPVATVVGGDRRSLSIAAASIIAKVTRDRLMTELASTYPLYGFDRHVGYGTPLHRDAIRRHGPAQPHRQTFLGKILQERLPL